MWEKSFIAGAAIALIAIVAQPTAAQGSRNLRICTGGLGITPDQQIEGCTAIIEAGGQDRANLASAYRNWGLAYIEKNDYERAIADYSRSIEIKPHADAYFGRGFARQRNRQYQLAIQDFDEALKLDSDHVAAKRNRESAARSAWVSAVDPKPFIERGEDLHDAKKYDEAIREFDEAIRIEPTNHLTFKQRGDAYLKKGDLERAMADYDQALKLDPESGVAISARAEVWAKKGDYVRAASDLKTGIALQGRLNKSLGVPEQIDGLDYLTLSEYYVKLKQYDLALAAIRKAHEYEGDDGFPVRYETGLILQELGRHREAVREFSADISRFPKDARSYYGRGVSYERLGDRKKALRDFKRFAALAEPKDWDEAGKQPGEARAKLAEYGLR